ncbi:hypothetical protein BGY98DRAFT_965900 [Russula aff. rugulosa BPL654]|nr:hypothetical protein BGY98DRAFT_965900 [Russula aff. rugulosa BPL654]
MCSRVFSEDAWPELVPATFFLSLTHFFHALSLFRSMFNFLRPIHDRYFSLGHPRSQLRDLLLSIASACSVRLTSVITPAFLFLPLPWQIAQNYTVCLCAFITDTISIAYSVCCPLFALDSTYNGVTTLVLPTFLRVSASSVPLLNRFAPWHYRLTQALPF